MFVISNGSLLSFGEKLFLEREEVLSPESFHVVFHQTSLNSEDEGECRGLGWSCVCVCFRGIFYQGYRCTRCKMAAHKECLGRVPVCGRNSGETLSARHVSVLMLFLCSISHVLLIHSTELSGTLKKVWTSETHSHKLNCVSSSTVLFLYCTLANKLDFKHTLIYNNNDKPIYTLWKWPWIQTFKQREYADNISCGVI